MLKHAGEDLSLIDRDALESRLRDGEEKLKILYEVSPVGVFQIDQHMRFVYANPAYQTIVGYSEGELRSLTTYDITAPQDMRMSQQVMDEARSKHSGVTMVEKRNVRKDGKIITVRITSREIKVGPNQEPMLFGIAEDITLQEEFKRIAKETSELMNAILNNSTAFVFVKDLEGRYTFVNSAFEGFLARSRAYILGKSDLELFPFETAKMIREIDQRILRGQKTEQMHEIVPGPRGDHHFSSVKFPIRNTEGDVIGLCGIAQEITDSKLLENELESNRNFLKAIMENSPAAIFAKDPFGRYTHVNAAFSKLAQKDPNHILGRTLGDLFPGVEAQEVMMVEQEIMISKTPLIRAEVRKKGGAISHSLVSRFPLLDSAGQVSGVCGIAMDMTGHQRDTMETGEIMKAIDRVAAIGLTDKEGRIILVNDYFCKISGYEREELLGKTHGIINSDMHPKPFFSNMWRTILAGKVWRGEIQNRRRDGSTYWMQTVISPIRNDGGAIEKFMAVRFDITDLKEAQRQILETNRLSALAKVYENITHEISNPLTIISGLVRSISKQIKVEDSEKQTVITKIENINQAIDRITKILKSLHTFAGGDDDEPLRPMSIGEIIDQIRLLISQRMVNDNIEIQIVGVKTPIISCRPSLLVTGFLELINNAIEAVQHMTIRKIAIESRDVEDHIEISIIDSGAGVPKEVADQMMEPFFSTKEAVKGVGLGLSVAKGIIESHHGKIFYDSESTQTRFVIHLPKRVLKKLPEAA